MARSDQSSIEAALALLQRGTSCFARATMAAAGLAGPDRPDGRVDDWLAQTIAEPAGIPMPRALALLWELRGRTSDCTSPMEPGPEILDYIGWCLTQGVRDGCVAVELIEARAGAVSRYARSGAAGNPAAADHGAAL